MSVTIETNDKNFKTTSDAEVLVRVENVSKKFCRSLKKSLWYGVKDIIHELNPRGRGDRSDDQDTYSASLRQDEFWAVDNVSFELRRGECLGLIGHNGAGKTTLLKMLNGLIKPDRGRIEMRGRVGALIALGAGFNPILTGRENVYVNASILGFSRKDTVERLPEIIEFSGLGDFMDMPVQSYSSGMQVRLGFAVAIMLKPDILLVDEVLAVGDAGFRVQCYNEINRISKDTAIILVSHSMTQIGKVCRRGIVMDHGRVELEAGTIGEAIEKYYSIFSQGAYSVEGSSNVALRHFVLRCGKSSWKIDDHEQLAQQDDIRLVPNIPIEFDAEFCTSPGVDAVSFLISISDAEEKLVAQWPSSVFRGLSEVPTHRLSLRLDSLPLNTGSYSMSIHVMNGTAEGWTAVLLGLRNVLRFSVKRDVFYGSAPVIHEYDWRLAPCHVHT